MKLKTIATVVLALTMLVISVVPTSGQNIAYWTFSENLHDGNYYRWEVAMTWEGNPITETNPAGNGPPFVDGSEIEVWITQNPYGVHLEETTQASDLDPYFDYKLDGNSTIDVEILPAVVLPNTYVNDDSTEQNAFYSWQSNPSTFPFFEGSDYLTRDLSFIENYDVFNATGTRDYPSEGRHVVESFFHEVNTGILHSYHVMEIYTNGSVMDAVINLAESHVSDGGAPLPEGASFSSLLDTGDVFTWEVRSLYQNQPKSGPNEPHQGSQIEIKILAEPENINLTDDTLNPDTYFQLKLDGQVLLITDTFEGPGDFAQFIYPMIQKFDNGTQLNFFDNIVAHPTDYFGNGATASKTGNVFSLHITEVKDDGTRNVLQDLQFDYDTGVMRYMHRNEVWTNGTTELDMEFVRINDVIPQGASFSPLLNTGDSFAWEVLNMMEHGVEITTQTEAAPVVGSIIEINILDEPENIDLTDDTLDPDAYFELKLDGQVLLIKDTFEGPGDFAQFIFPVIVDMDGTVVNFFEYVATDPTDVFGPDATASISANVFSLHVVEVKDEGTRNVVQDLEFDVDTGVMRYMHRVETWTNGTVELDMEFSRTDVSSPSSSPSNTTEESNGGLPIPAPGFALILPVLMALPLIRRKK